MTNTLCPTCGAPVAFRSAASVMAVCGYCRSTLLREADAVRSIGRMSDVLEDYSPIQLGTSGTADGHAFTVVGRIQLRYGAGFWNEWYVVDDAGQGAWLSDASAQYAFTRATPMPSGFVAPRFDALAPGAPLDLGPAPDGSRAVFIASDIREARCTGGQGELPFQAGAGYVARVADFRRGDAFATLDWSDESSSTGPTLYQGHAVQLDRIGAQLLRDPETIRDTAGRIKGKVANLECPSCGASIAFAPGATTHLVCQTCHATVDASSDVVEVIAAARRVDAVKTSLPLGATATVLASPYMVIGLMRRAEIDEDASTWTEYLLYAPQKGFFWLVETDEGFERSDVLDAWPYWFRNDQALLDGERYDKLYDYRSVVQYAAGAFNWKVAVGDTNEITEFRRGDTKLAAEADDHELMWSRSRPVARRDLVAWFGDAIDAGALPAATSSPPTVVPPGGYRRIAKWLTVLLVVLNLIPLAFAPGRVFVTTLLAIVCLWFPAWMMDAATRRTGT